MILGHTHQLPACVWVLSHSAGFFTTEPPGKPSSHLKNNQFTCLFFVYHMAVLCSSLGVTEIGVCNSLWYHHWVEGRGPVSVQWHWTWSLSQLPLSEPSSPSSWRSQCPTLWSTEKPSHSSHSVKLSSQVYLGKDIPKLSVNLKLLFAITSSSRSLKYPWFQLHIFSSVQFSR